MKVMFPNPERSEFLRKAKDYVLGYFLYPHEIFINMRGYGGIFKGSIQLEFASTFSYIHRTLFAMMSFSYFEVASMISQEVKSVP